MKRALKYSFLFALIIVLSSADLFAQLRIIERGTTNFRKVGVHRGNQVRTVFSNFGVIAQPGTEGPRGAWKFDANGYVGDVSPVVGLQLPIKDYRRGTSPIDGIPDTIFSVVITPVDRPGSGEGGGGKSFTFEPIPGFANPGLDEIGKGVAMSHLPETWPPQWPDFPDWTYSGEPLIVDGVDKTPAVDWNGFFGRAQFNADQESYFWMDDNNDQENFDNNDFLPDANDLSRRGHALQVSVRGLQWSNFLAQDVLFWLYNIKNDGTEDYDRTAFGILVGTYVGVETPEWNDDASFFDVRESITYTWDFGNFISPSANPKWLPNPRAVGYIAYAFLESPGNPFDGIDNDADNGGKGSAPFFTANDFPETGRLINAGDKLVLIDRTTFQRSIFTMPNDTVTVVSMGVPFKLRPGVTRLSEGNINLTTTDPIGVTARDGIDNDLDGLIDENFQLHFKQFKKSDEKPPAQPIVLIDIEAPVQYRDYLSLSNGNPLIDESRDDGIDNDGDWNIEFDDVGADGKEGTNDFGEGDGVPTPGEPNFDVTDVDESDQIGLSSFQYFVPAGDITMSDDVDMWRRLTPGFFQVPKSIINNVAVRGEDGDFLYGTGYFPLLKDKTERFSLALAFGDDFSAVLKTKQIAQTIFNANYQFPKPPTKPTVTAVAEDKKVTLYWDNVAESSVDPTTKIKDFEGYKIYKGTDPDLTDALLITDFNGQKVFYKPTAQFDLINGIRGLFVPSQTLLELTSGAPFSLGTDNGVQNFFVDTDVLNGRTYYYAVVAYDRGDASKEIFPSENSRFISKDALGRITTDINTVAVIPNAPVAGYVPPPSGLTLDRIIGASTATPFFEVVDPLRVLDSTYILTFTDSLRKGVNISALYSVQLAGSGQYVVKNAKITPENGVVFNGVRLSIDSSYQSLDSIKLNPSLTGWNIKDAKNLKIQIALFVSTTIPTKKAPEDYLVVFSDEYADSSDKLTGLLGNGAPEARQVNFKVFNYTDRNNPQRIKFIFTESNNFRRDTLSNLDQITLSNEDGTILTWKVIILGDDSSNVPKGGDSLLISIFKPFSDKDEFVFTTTKPSYSVDNAREQLNRVKAVPNPYVVANLFEQPLPPTVRGRGERIINFINLPPGSKINIYTSAGNLIRTLEHDGDINNGSVSWDVRTKEGLDVAYGVYFYVVEVEGISDKKMGKLAIIK